MCRRIVKVKTVRLIKIWDTDLFDFKTKSRTTNAKTVIFVDVVYPVNLQKLSVHTYTQITAHQHNVWMTQVQYKDG